MGSFTAKVLSPSRRADFEMMTRAEMTLVASDTATKADDMKGSAAAAAAANEAITDTVSPAVQICEAQGSVPSVIPAA